MGMIKKTGVVNVVHIYAQPDVFHSSFCMIDMLRAKMALWWLRKICSIGKNEVLSACYTSSQDSSELMIPSFCEATFPLQQCPDHSVDLIGFT